MFSAVTQRALLRTTKKNPLSASQSHSHHRVLERPTSCSRPFGTSTLLPGLDVDANTKKVFPDEVSLKDLNKPVLYPSDDEEVKSWTTARVLEWAKDIVKLPERHIQKLQDNEITGKALVTVTKEELVTLYRLPAGPASELYQAIEALKTPTITSPHPVDLSPFLKAIQSVTTAPIPWSPDEWIKEIPEDEKEQAREDPGLRVASLPEGMCWLSLDSSHLFVRPCYNILWEEIYKVFRSQIGPGKRDPTKIFSRVLVLGNSGIGKTISLNYILIRALKEGIRVLFETRDTRYYFNGNIIQQESVTHGTELERIRRDRAVLLLHDHQARREPPLIFNGAFVVAPVSPDPINYKEFRKHNTLELWLPLPTRNELVAMNSIEPNLALAELFRRISLYGVIPRTIFAPDQNTIKRRLDSKISDFKVGEHFLSMLRTAELPESQHGLSWWVVHVSGSPDLHDVQSIDWASDTIRERVLSQFTSGKLAELELFLAQAIYTPPQYSTQPTKEYECWAALKIACGIKLDVFRFELGEVVTKKRNGTSYIEDTNKPKEMMKTSEKPDPIQLLPLKLTRVQSLNVSTVRAGNNLYVSTNTCEPLCDAATLTTDGALVLFQMTLGKEHNISITKFNEYIADIREQHKKRDTSIKSVRLVFIVPQKDNFVLPCSEWKNVPTATGLDISVGVAELMPHVV